MAPASPHVCAGRVLCIYTTTVHAACPWEAEARAARSAPRPHGPLRGFIHAAGGAARPVGPAAGCVWLLRPVGRSAPASRMVHEKPSLLSGGTRYCLTLYSVMNRVFLKLYDLTRSRHGPRSREVTVDVGCGYSCEVILV